MPRHKKCIYITHLHGFLRRLEEMAWRAMNGVVTTEDIANELEDIVGQMSYYLRRAEEEC